jgi:hypothetical protein
MPMAAKIVNFEQIKSVKGPVNRVTIVNQQDQVEYVFDIFKDVQRSLIDQFGQETDSWIGKRIRISGEKKGDKFYKRIDAVF